MLTEKMTRALTLAIRNNAVFAGQGNRISSGCLGKVAASTLLGLERRDCLKITIGPDGGMMGVITERGRALIAETEAAK